MKATKNMTFKEILDSFPESAKILHEEGLHCLGCMMAHSETVEQGCKMHGKTDKDIDSIIEKINTTTKDDKSN